LNKFVTKILKYNIAIGTQGGKALGNTPSPVGGGWEGDHIPQIQFIITL